MGIHWLVVVLPPILEQAVAHLLQPRVAKARRPQEGNDIEQGKLTIRPQVLVGLYEQLIGISQRLQGVFEHVFRARAIAGRPQVFGDRDQVVDHSYHGPYPPCRAD